MNRPSTDFASRSSVNKPAVLFLAPEAPYPMIGGGPIRAASVLEYLAQRFSVHAILFREPDLRQAGSPHPAAAIPPGRVDRVDVVDLPFHSKGALARVMRNASRLARSHPPLLDRFSGFERQIARFVAGQQYAVAVLEHFWTAPYVELLRARAKRVILDLHNIDSVWHQSMAHSERGLSALGHRRFARSALQLERQWLPQFDDILATSESDAALARAIVPGARVSVYPNALPYVAPPPRAERREIVFSGNLEYPPNIQAVRFFDGKIWPALQSRWPELKWKILGKNPGPFRDWPAKDPSIELTGFVQDAVGVIAQSQVAIVPVLAGSGTRIKILEAWAARTPVVSTTLGAEGLECRDREHLLLADDAESFTTAVSELLALADDRARIGAAGRRLYEERYTWQAAWKALDSVLAGNGLG
jgi:glycosyltransferase involved in cell wall biosynthesis